jgi:DnaJ-class molecular chaperone
MGELLALPKPRHHRDTRCPFCTGVGRVMLSVYGPRECPTCRGSGVTAETWLTEAFGINRRARELGLAS